MVKKKDQEIAEIKGFLADKLTEFEVKRRAPRLITSVGEISRHTGIDEETVKKWLSRQAKEMTQAGIVVVRVGKTDVVIRLAGRTKT